MGVAKLHKFRQAAGDHAALVAANDNDKSLELVLGQVVSGTGEAVRVGAMLRPERSMRKYSHIGEVPVPAEMLKEFQKGCKRFFFYADNGEEFDEIHVIDQLGEGRDITEQGTIVLLRKSADVKKN